MPAKYWNDPNAYYAQNNNAMERLLNKTLSEVSIAHGFSVSEFAHLEFCGPSASVNCIAARTPIKDIVLPGGFIPQPEDLLSLYFHDPRNLPLFNKLAPQFDFAKMLPNRCPSLYPRAVQAVFGVSCKFLDGKLTVGQLKENLIAGNTIQLCLKSPGHFVAAVNFDEKTNEIVYNDPFDGRGGVKGFNRRMSLTEYVNNVKDYAIIYCW